jgi:homoserine dehydrogenase
MENISGPYYFRISAVDQPGVLATIAGILGKNGISIESVIQKKRQDVGAVPVVIRTHEAGEKAVLEAIQEIDSLAIVTEKTVIIRILS